jgi:branched-chain amino acid transport system permease protein
MQQIVTILGVAGIYALLATGLVLVYKTSRIVSLAQGHIAILCAFFVSSLISSGYGWPAVLLATIVGCAALAGMVYFAVMRQLVGEPPFVGLMATIGIAILLRGVMVLAFGGVSVTTHSLLGGAVNLFGQNVPAAHVLVAAASWAIVGIVVTVGNLSGLGLFMRATTDNVVLAAQRGINIDMVLCSAWVIAVLAAAAGGYLHGQRALVSTAAILIGVNALIAALIGGMDSYVGAILGCIIVAASEHLVLQYFEARYADLAPIGLMLVILTLRPWGLFGTPEEVERV